MKLGMQVGLGPGHTVLDGDPAPQFSVHICCSQTAAWIKMSLRMELGLGPVDFVLDGDPAPLPQKGAEPPPQFSAHFYCSQTAGCIKMPLGMEVDLSPGDFGLDGDLVAFLQKGTEPPIFGPRLLWPNGCMYQDAAWYGGRRRHRPTRHCVRWGPCSPPLKEHSPQFSAIVRCGQTAG